MGRGGCTYVDAILSCGGDDLPGVELEGSDRVIVFEGFEDTSGAEVPYLPVIVRNNGLSEGY